MSAFERRDEHSEILALLSQTPVTNPSQTAAYEGLNGHTRPHGHRRFYAQIALERTTVHALIVLGSGVASSNLASPTYLT